MLSAAPMSHTCIQTHTQSSNSEDLSFALLYVWLCRPACRERKFGRLYFQKKGNVSGSGMNS